MKLLLILALSTGDWIDQTLYPTAEVSAGGSAGGSTLIHMDDDIVVSFGNTSAAPDCWFEWDTGAATDNFRLVCTDVDGGGTDGVVWYVNTSTDDIVATGNFSAAAITGSAEANFTNNAAAVTFGAVGTDADVVLAFDAVTAQGSITYMEDEDRFDFDNDIDVIADLTAGTITSDAGVTLAAGSMVNWTGRSEITSPSDGELIHWNDAQSAGYCMSADTNGAVRFYASDCSTRSSGVYLDATEYITEGGSNTVELHGYNGARVYQDGDRNNSGAAWLNFPGAAAREMTATTGTQYLVQATPHLNQSGDAVYKAIYLDVTDTASGSGQDYLLDLSWGGSPMLLLQDNGDMFVTGTIKTEVVTADAPSEPHACDATHAGVIVAIDDTNNTAYDEPCICLNLDGTGYDWRQLSDVTGTACVF